MPRGASDAQAAPRPSRRASPGAARLGKCTDLGDGLRLPFRHAAEQAGARSQARARRRRKRTATPRRCRQAPAPPIQTRNLPPASPPRGPSPRRRARRRGSRSKSCPLVLHRPASFRAQPSRLRQERHTAGKRLMMLPTGTRQQSSRLPCSSCHPLSRGGGRPVVRGSSLSAFAYIAPCQSRLDPAPVVGAPCAGLFRRLLLAGRLRSDWSIPSRLHDADIKLSKRAAFLETGAAGKGPLAAAGPDLRVGCRGRSGRARSAGKPG